MNCTNKDWDSDVNISREMGLQKINTDVVEYREKLHNLRTELTSEVGRVYRRLVTSSAKQLGMKLPNSDVIVFDFKHVGEEFRVCPSWKSAEVLYHSIYTSMDNLPNFLEDMELHFMNIKKIRYSEEDNPTTILKQSGIRSCIVAKINAIRKDLNKKISGKHGFRIVKSLNKQADGRQAPRRKKGVFNTDFIKYKDNKNPIEFNEYLKKNHQDTYCEWVAQVNTGACASNVFSNTTLFEVPKINIDHVARKLEYTITNETKSSTVPTNEVTNDTIDATEILERKKKLLATLKSLDDLEKQIKEKEANVSERLKTLQNNNTSENDSNLRNKKKGINILGEKKDEQKKKRGRKVR